MTLTQAERDAKRDSTLMRIGRALLDLIRHDAKKKGMSARLLVESILRTRYKVAK